MFATGLTTNPNFMTQQIVESYSQNLDFSTKREEHKVEYMQEIAKGETNSNPQKVHRVFTPRKEVLKHIFHSSIPT